MVVADDKYMNWLLRPSAQTGPWHCIERGQKYGEQDVKVQSWIHHDYHEWAKLMLCGGTDGSRKDIFPNLEIDVAEDHEGVKTEWDGLRRKAAERCHIFFARQERPTHENCDRRPCQELYDRDEAEEDQKGRTYL